MPFRNWCNTRTISRPPWFEVARAFRDVNALPAQRVARMQGGAAAFCLNAAGDLLTNCHVAREEIEAQGRTHGSTSVAKCTYLRAEAWADLQWVANPPQTDWKAGYDWTLLRARDERVNPLPLARRDPEIGGPVWSFGFPLRSRRTADEYPDADGSLRVSRGVVTGLRAPRLLPRIWWKQRRARAGRDWVGSGDGPQRLPGQRAPPSRDRLQRRHAVRQRAGVATPPRSPSGERMGLRLLNAKNRPEGRF